MRTALLLICCAYTLVKSQNIGNVVAFANKQWNCADPACSSTVPKGSGQNNYECAEFVSRSLAAGGYIPNLGPTDPQSKYSGYQYNGKTYDLLWVSSVQGPPLGMEDLLKVLNWGTASSVQAGTVVIVTGADGPHSHTGIGVGNGQIDAHNNAEYQVGNIGSINALYSPPGSVPTSGTSSTSGSGSTSPSGSGSGSTSPSGSGSGSTSPSGSGSGSTSPSGSGSGSGPSGSGSGSTSPSGSGSGSTSPSGSGSGSGSGKTSSPSGSGTTTSGSGSTTSTTYGAYIKHHFKPVSPSNTNKDEKNTVAAASVARKAMPKLSPKENSKEKMEKVASKFEW